MRSLNKCVALQCLWHSVLRLMTSISGNEFSYYKGNMIAIITICYIFTDFNEPEHRLRLLR